jgi:hypothetical protein
MSKRKAPSPSSLAAASAATISPTTTANAHAALVAATHNAYTPTSSSSTSSIFSPLSFDACDDVRGLAQLLRVPAVKTLSAWLDDAALEHAFGLNAGSGDVSVVVTVPTPAALRDTLAAIDAATTTSSSLLSPTLTRRLVLWTALGVLPGQAALEALHRRCRRRAGGGDADNGGDDSDSDDGAAVDKTARLATAAVAAAADDVVANRCVRLLFKSARVALVARQVYASSDGVKASRMRIVVAAATRGVVKRGRCVVR